MKVKNTTRYKSYEATELPLGDVLPNGNRKKKSKQCFATFWSSMAEHTVFKSLTKNQKLLYIYCKLQIINQNRTTAEKELFGNDFFTFEREKWKDTYELYTQGNQAQFYKDMRALIEKGFVKVKSNGKANHKRNIYVLSDEWHKK